MRPHGRAQISARAPRALAVCQRCGFLYNHDNLQWQWDWLQGPRLFNLRLLVCKPCLDKPQRQLGAIVLPPDPPPLWGALPEPYAIDEYWPRLLQGGQPRVLQGGRARYLQVSKYFDTN